MISIITAVYNQLDMNRLFWDYLLKYTDNPFELIVIDNASTDDGIAHARYDTLIFPNNDVSVSGHWIKHVNFSEE